MANAGGPGEGGQTLKQYNLPDGRRVHIIAHPDHLESLKRTLSQNLDGKERIDVYVRNSPEHLETLRIIEAHHKSRHDEIRQKHVQVFEQLDPVTAELEAVAAELSQITHRHIALDANFDRFGYSAHIRVHQAPSDDQPASDASSQQVSQSLASRSKRSETIPFWRRPGVRQYYHRGLIWRMSESEEVATFELFFDLLYVGIVATIGDAAAEAATGEALLQFVVTFFLVWKIWTELVIIVQWFVSNSITQRISVLFLGAFLVGLATNIADVFESTYTPLISFYVGGRLLQVSWLLTVALVNPLFRVSLIGNSIGILLAIALWIGSIHVEYPDRLAVIFVAILFDVFDKLTQTLMVRLPKMLTSERTKKYVDRAGMAPAINIEHRSERQNAFVTLIFGYMAVNLLFQHGGESTGMNGFFGKAIMGLITAFCFNSIYFEIDNKNIETHAIRRHPAAYSLWQNSHLPFMMAFTLASGSLARLVVAHDAPNTDPSQLTEHYAAESEGEIGQAHRWFYSAGLGVALAFMGAVALTHVHRNTSHQRIPKIYRLCFRWAASVVMICLPLAGDRLDSVQFIGIDTSLVVLVLAVDFWGSTTEGESFWWDGTACSYAADCTLKKRDIEALDKAVGTMEVSELVEKNVTREEMKPANGVIQLKATT